MKKIKDTDTEVVYKCPYCGTGQIRIEKNGAHKYGYCDICDAAYIQVQWLHLLLVLFYYKRLASDTVHGQFVACKNALLFA